MSLDLNCDLGEGEPWIRTAALLRWVTSANIACGGHAGEVASMERCVRRAAELGVRVGAHPGLPESFGRGDVRITPDQLSLLVLQQVGGLHRIAQGCGVRLHHVKLHGSLYHATDADPELARAYLGTLRQWFPGLRLYARAGGPLARQARTLGIRVWEEAFVDRGYQADGNLVPRSAPDALIVRPADAVTRIRQYLEKGNVTSVGGKPVSLRAETWCLHGDGPTSVPMARAVRKVIPGGAGPA